MNIAILTFTDGTNYGQRLQNYALHYIIKSMGHNCKTLRYTTVSKSKFIMKNVKALIFGLMNIKNGKDRLSRIKKFNDFNSNYIQFYDRQLYPSTILDNLNKQFDIFVAGSDQIWNPYSSDVDDFYFLSFTSFEKSVTYAPSFSVNEIPKEFEKLYRDRLRKIKILSSREEAGINIIKSLTGKIAPCIVDPTFLLERGDWEKIESPPSITGLDKEYFLCYFLGESQTINVKHYTEGKNIIDISPASGLSDLGPSEFIYLISHAKGVFTDSFHGTVFSLIFQRPFLYFDRMGEVNSMSSRFETLDSKFGISERKFGRCEKDKFYDIDYFKLEKKIEKERNRAKEFLEDTLK